MKTDLEKDKVLLYQPYYSRNGHFKDFFNLYFEFNKQHGIPVLGVIGSDKESTFEDIISFSAFLNWKTTRILSNYFGFLKISNLLSNHNIKALHFLDFEILTLVSYLLFKRAELKNKTLVLHQHSVNYFVEEKSESSSLLLTIYSELARKSYQFLDRYYNVKIVTNGTWITQALKNFYKPKNTEIITSTWGADTPAKNLNQKKPNSFLYLGIIREDKNIEYLIDQFSDIKLDFKLTIAGFPKDYSKSEIVKIVTKSGISETNLTLKLEYLNEEEYYSYLSSHQYIILPYRASNKSNSGPLIEAIQHNCIPIVSSYGERGEIVSNNKIGYSFNFEEKDALKRIIEKILQVNDSDKKAILHRIKTIKSSFKWSNILDQLINKADIYN